MSLADEDVADAVSSLELLAPLADGVELNASCPNVSWGRDRDQEAHLRALIEAFVARTDRPVLVKLPPFVTRRRAGGGARAGADRAGGRGARASRVRTPGSCGDARLAVGQGGLSGRALWPQTLEIVAAVREATGAELPVNACGGVFTADDVVDCLDAGAATVQIYTALIYEGPGIVGELTRGLATRLRERGRTLAGNAGTAKPA